MTVVALDLDGDAVAGVSTHAYALDVSNADDVDEVMGRILAEFGRIDVLVNNAGILDLQCRVENMEIARLIPQDDATKIIKVMDNGKVLMVRPEVTCAWFVGDRNDTRFRSLFDGLDLHP